MIDDVIIQTSRKKIVNFLCSITLIGCVNLKGMNVAIVNNTITTKLTAWLVWTK